MDKEFLSLAAKAAHDRLPDGSVFILMVAPPGENVRLGYVSNMDRPTAINVLKEWLIKSSGEEEWMKHLK